MKQKTGFEFEEHQRLGAELHHLKRRLNALVVQMQKAYGVSSRQAKSAIGCVEAIKQLRSDLDDSLYEDFFYGKTNQELGEVYYGRYPFKAVPLKGGR